jgi:hypothetical protein
MMEIVPPIAVELAFVVHKGFLGLRDLCHERTIRIKFNKEQSLLKVG